MLRVLRFNGADKEWLRLVCDYRMRRHSGETYDVIAGPVANDRIVDVINQYLSGFITEDMALQLLPPMHFRDQWALKTERALDAIAWKETVLA